VRNVFDQYDQWENRLTHALATALGEDDRLLHSFLNDVAQFPAPREAKLRVIEQSYPGAETNWGDQEGTGLPDAWILDHEAWSVLIESKIGSPLTADQLRRHLATARRRGYEKLRLLAIVVSDPKIAVPNEVRVIEWRSVFSWLQAHVDDSRWAMQVSEYMGIVESKMTQEGTDLDGSLTKFSGFKFGPSHPYTYLEAKRVLRLAMQELRASSRLQTELAIDPEQTGRPAITGGDTVWDYLGLRIARGAKKFNLYPHLTLVLGRDEISAQLVLPHALRSPLKKRLTALEAAHFRTLLIDVEKNLEPVVEDYGATPIARCLHRHFRGQKVSMIDAKLEFDLRTVAVSPVESSVKPCDAWWQAALAGVQTRGINYEIGIGTKLHHVDEGPLWSADSAIDFVERSWLACGPILDLLTR